MALGAEAPTPAVSGVYDIPVGSQLLILSASWTTPTATAPALSLIEPDGTTLDPSGFAAAGIFDVTSLDSSTSDNLGILTPAAGDWQLEVDNSSALGQVSFSAFAEAATPTLTLSTPTATADGGWQFNWSAGSLPPNAAITFYAASDSSAFDGTRFRAADSECRGSVRLERQRRATRKLLRLWRIDWPRGDRSTPMHQTNRSAKMIRRTLHSP